MNSDAYVPPGVYLMVCAPTGYPLRDFPAVNHACAELRAANFNVYSPYEGQDPEDYNAPASHTRAASAYLFRDLLVACHPHCNGLALLPGWERSYGASREAAAAQWCGKTLFRYDPDQPECPGNEIHQTVHPSWCPPSRARPVVA